MDGLADMVEETPEQIDAPLSTGADAASPPPAPADQAAGPGEFSDPPSDPESCSPRTNSDEAVATADEGPMADQPTEILPQRVVEAILFASDTALPAAKIAQVLSVGTARDIRKHIATLNDHYRECGLSFRIDEIAGGFQMLTLPAYNTWLTKLLRTRQETKLSQAAMETLAIVAYKQPCTRADVEAVRGVAAGDLLNRLREMNLVKIVGRAEDLGRPLLYGTTRRFLEAFGLPSLEDLPRVEALSSGGGATRAAARLAETLTPESEVQTAPAEDLGAAPTPLPPTPTAEIDPITPTLATTTEGDATTVEEQPDHAAEASDTVEPEMNRDEDEQHAVDPLPAPPLRLALPDESGTA